MNEYFVKWATDGITALSTAEQGNLEALALSCPLINGPAVYKARTIYTASIGEIDFDDLDICHSAGVYKNGNAIDNYVIDPNLIANLSDQGFKVYPNPASEQLTIDYALESTEEGTFIVYDMLGKERVRLSLSNAFNRVTVGINELAKGVYLYRYLKNDVTFKTGKLIKE